MVQFDTITFRKILHNYFGRFVWIEKKVQYSRVLLHEVPTKNFERWFKLIMKLESWVYMKYRGENGLFLRIQPNVDLNLLEQHASMITSDVIEIKIIT